MFRHIRNGIIGSTALALVSAAALAATPPDMLVIGTDVGAIPTLDPAALNARTVSELVSNLYDNLLKLDPNDLQSIQPMLAASWEVAPDNSSITLQLRDDATFASGNPVTAEDAAWTIQRVIKLGQVGATDFAQWGFTADNVDQLVRAEGDHTLVIELPEQVSIDLVLYSLAGSSLGIIDRQVALEHETDGDLARDWLRAQRGGQRPFHAGRVAPRGHRRHRAARGLLGRHAGDASRHHAPRAGIGKSPAAARGR
ncbi:MAG: ABC transporter substrate-binding protein [Geminicoccaceae bacterium]